MHRFIPWLILLFPALELWVLIKVGKEVGALATVALVILAMFVGLWLLRLRSARIAKNMQMELASGHIPSTPIVDTFCLMIAGWLFVFPGFVSDILAVLLLIPFVRKALFALLAAKLKTYGFQAQTMHFESQSGTGGASWTYTNFGGSGAQQHEPRGNAVIIDCEAEAVEQEKGITADRIASDGDTANDKPEKTS